MHYTASIYCYYNTTFYQFLYLIYSFCVIVSYSLNNFLQSEFYFTYLDRIALTGFYPEHNKVPICLSHPHEFYHSRFPSAVGRPQKREPGRA